MLSTEPSPKEGSLTEAPLAEAENLKKQKIRRNRSRKIAQVARVSDGQACVPRATGTEQGCGSLWSQG